jgi:hypothetical protein
MSQPAGRSPMSEAKPFCIAKNEVWEAYKRVKENKAKAIRDTFRRWNLPNRSDKAIEDLSRMFNPIIRGWLQYYGR